MHRAIGEVRATPAQDPAYRPTHPLSNVLTWCGALLVSGSVTYSCDAAGAAGTAARGN